MINAYLVDHAVLITKTHDEHGEIISEDHEEIKCYINYKITKFVNFKGEEVISDKSILIANRAISLDEEFEIEGARFPIQKITRAKDLTQRFIEVFL